MGETVWNLKLWLAFLCFARAIAVSAESAPLDCSKKSLADAVRDATGKDSTIVFTGICAGPVVIATDGLTLKGVGTAVIDGSGADALTIIGASRVSLIDIEVTNGLAGIVARNGAHVSFVRVSSHDNLGSGIVLRTASSAVLFDVSATGNGGIGLDGDDGVSITLSSSSATANAIRDIQLTFGTRADLRTLAFGTYSCDATVLVRGTSGITCPH
jgi:hypothetical protein